MGLKDKFMKLAGKVNHFMGGHGVKVIITEVERQPAHSAEMGINDTIVKGKFDMEASDSSCQILSMKAEFIMETECENEDGETETMNLLLGEDCYPDPHVSRCDDMLQYPFGIEAGSKEQDFFSIHLDQFTIPEALQKRNVALADAKFYVKVTADVKGSPYDPETTTPLVIVG